jgi:biotin operon repressor
MSEKLTKSAQAVLNYLKEHAENGSISIEQNVLAFCLHLSRMSISKAIKQLQEAGHIRTESNKENGTANTYFLTSYAPAPVPSKTAFKIIPYSKPAVAMAKMNSKGKKPDTITGILTLECKKVKVQIENFAQIANAFSVNTHKLLCAGLIAFAENNNIGDISETINCNVVIPLKEYATMCGYDIEEHPTDDPIKEKNRIKNLLKHIRKQISSDLDMLYNSSLTWNESTKKANRDYLNIRLISASAIRNGYIYMTFGQDFARYLKLRRLTQYPITLFSIDARSVNAYRIGQALSFHYNNDNNLKSGIANRIKIRTLLDYTDLPTIGEIRQLRTSWEQKIKEPFEKALDELYQKGVLSDWWYCKSKDIPLTDEEIQDYFVDFEKWFEMLIHFEINDAVNHTQRLSKKETSQPEKKK